MAFISPQYTSTAPMSFAQILARAPSIDSNLFSQVPVLNQQAAAGMLREGLAAGSLLEAERIKADSLESINKANIKAQEDARKKRMAETLLQGGLGGGLGSNNRFAGQVLADALQGQPQTPTQQLQDTNAFLTQAQTLLNNAGATGFGTSLAFTRSAMQGAT